ncbi:MAG: hypothetical protein JXC32_16805, partial [Anaerolineae bacterium]|nr:hypothetical protein [Anaerolineae bacterium]
MEHVCVHVAIEGGSEAWAAITAGLKAAPDVQLVRERDAGERVDVVFYDVNDPASAALMKAPDPRRGFWTVGVDLTARQVVALS